MNRSILIAINVIDESDLANAVRKRFHAKPTVSQEASTEDRNSQVQQLQQARQESNLQPPVLETGALPIELRT